MIMMHRQWERAHGLQFNVAYIVNAKRREGMLQTIVSMLPVARMFIISSPNMDGGGQLHH